jgi:uncharacterized protein (TIRG00374 family)
LKIRRADTWINILKFLLFLAIGCGILYWVYNSQNQAFQAQCKIDGVAPEDCSLLKKLVADFRSANVWWLLVVVLCFQASNVFRAFRWQMIFKPMGHEIRFGNAFWTIMIGYFANLGLSRAGEVVRGVSLARYEKIKVDKVIGTIALDRILDLISMALVIALAMAMEYDAIYNYLASNMRDFNVSAFLRGTIFQSFLVGILLLFVLLIIFQRQIRQSMLYFKIKAFILGFYEGIRVIKRIEKPFLFFIYSVLIWVCYYLMTYFALFSFAPTASLGPNAALLVFVFGSFGILIPSPGGMGTYHALVVASLAIYHIRGDDAFSLANIIFFDIQIFTTILFGILALIILPLTNKKAIPLEEVEIM